MSVTVDGAPASDIDFLSLPIAAGEGVVSGGGGEFRIETPWAIVHFGSLSLKPGWWRLDCKGGPDAVEVRMSSSQNPLIVIPGGAARIYVSDPRGYDVSLLVSPWPGVYAFSKLRLHRLRPHETAKLIAGAAGRLVRRKDPLKLLLRATRRLMAGQAVGLSMPTTRAVADNILASAPIAVSEIRPPINSLVRDHVTLHVREGDRIHQSAVSIAHAAFDRDPGLVAAYSDVRETGRVLPHPEWDAALGHSGAFDDAPLFLRAGVSASTLAEVIEQFGSTAVGRIPLPLVDRPVASRTRPRATATPKLASTPRVSVIIPTKYRIDLLAKCLDGLVRTTGYPDIEIVIVDNGVTDPKFPMLVAKIAKSLSIRTIDDKGPFNFSRLVNAGAKVADGEVILLLNDDIEPIETGWLHKLVASAMEPQVGAVGPRLLYPDASIQHAGVVLGLGGTCAHLWRGLDEETAAANPYVMSAGARMAVTGACLAVKRHEFEAIGGFDEEAFPVAYNDIDFCLRLHAKGLRNFYRGDAALIHHESQSRGADDVSAAKHKRQSAEAARFLDRWRYMINADPHFSPAFNPEIEIGAAHRANYAPSSAYLDL